MAKDKKSRGLANPVLLKPFEKDEIVVIIETPKGSRNKYAYEPDERIFTLKKVLPAGMTFPYDFGFVPSTHAWPDGSGCRPTFASRNPYLRLGRSSDWRAPANPYPVACR